MASPGYPHHARSSLTYQPTTRCSPCRSTPARRHAECMSLDTALALIAGGDRQEPEKAPNTAQLCGWRILSDHQSRRADRVAMRARRGPDLVDMECVAQSILLQMICARLYVSVAELPAMPNRQLELGGGVLALRCVICLSRE
jgi:hypothetical protein